MNAIQTAGYHAHRRDEDGAATVLIDGLSRQDFYHVVQGFADFSLYQSWDWADIMARAARSDTSTIVLKRGTSVVGAAILRIKKLPFIGGLAYGRWAPLWQTPGATVDDLKILLQAIRDEYAERRGLLVCLTPRLSIDAPAHSEVLGILETLGYYRDSATAPYRTYLLDLRQSLDDIRKGFQKRWRNNLAQAERQGFEVRKGTDDDLFAEFLELYRDMLRRKGFAPRVDPEQLQEINHALPPNARMVVTIAFKGGMPVSGDIDSHLGDTSLGLLAASNVVGLQSHAAHLIWWEQIHWAREHGLSWCDLGGVDYDTNRSVAESKSRLGGLKCEYVGRYCYARRNVRASTLKTLFKAYSRVRQLRH